MSISWQIDVEPRPAILVLPPDAASLDEAYAAIELWEHYAGKTLDATQRLVVEVMMAETSAGRWAARTTGREMARQNGKGDEIEVVELWDLIQRGAAIVHTAHELITVSSAHSRLAGVIMGHPDLRRKKKKILNGLGQQAIELHNGGIIQYRTRTNGGGRGLDDISRLVIDEAQHAQPEQLASSTPILLANPNPQTNFIGTGGIAGLSDLWWKQRIRALSPDPGSFGYVGHTAETVRMVDGVVEQEPVDPSDRGKWRDANPSLINGRGEIEFFEEQFRTLGPTLFAREHLCVWDPPSNDGNKSAKLPGSSWTLTGRGGMSPPPKTIAFAVSADLGWSSVAWCGGSLSDPWVEVARHERGTAWLPLQLAKMQADIKATRIAWYAGGVAGSVLPAIREAFVAAGLDPEVLQPMQSTEYRSACSLFYSDVTELGPSGLPRLRRPLDNGALDVAVANAGERAVGGSWVWDDRSVSVPVSPLEAATVARALLGSSDKPKRWVGAA